MENHLKFSLRLSREEKDILRGQQGETLQKIMKTVVHYGEACRAERLVRIEGNPHFVIPVALPGIGPRIEMLKEIIDSGLATQRKFTVDPRPMDLEAVKLTPQQIAQFNRLYGDQAYYEDLLRKLGLRDGDAFTCTCYLPEVGNIPRPGAVLAWSESSAVVYANSVLGARTNRNAALIDLLSNIVGRTPFFGLLTDEGRRADWLFEVKTSKLPDPQLLGGAIGKETQDGVPFVAGLDRFLGSGLSSTTTDYLKDMGAACAAIGAVGLFHVENITPEAREQERKLLRRGYRTAVLDDETLQRLEESLPVLWKDPGSAPKWCLIGCPHLSHNQLRGWTDSIREALEAKRQNRLKVETVLCAAPDVISVFDDKHHHRDELSKRGVKISPMCPEMFMNNPLVAREPVITNSNKLRAYTPARFFKDKDILKIIVGGSVIGYE